MFDSHAHVLFDSFNEDRDAVITRARQAGLSGWLEIGTDLASSRKAVAFASTQPGVFATVGVHPGDIGELAESDWSEIETLLSKPRVVAVGEVGFDFYRGGREQEQLPVLSRFIQLAIAQDLPVIFHVRDPAAGESSHPATAHEAMIKFLQALPASARPRGVMHTYSGNQDQAQIYLELGMFLSFSGVVTFKNAGVTAEVARTVPADRLLIETDSPFLTPEPFRGQRNEPAQVTYVAQKIAQLRGVPVEEIAAATDRNAEKLFGL